MLLQLLLFNIFKRPHTQRMSFLPLVISAGGRLLLSEAGTPEEIDAVLQSNFTSLVLPCWTPASASLE